MCWHCGTTAGHEHWEETLRTVVAYDRAYRRAAPLTSCAKCDKLFPSLCVGSAKHADGTLKASGAQLFGWDHACVTARPRTERKLQCAKGVEADDAVQPKSADDKQTSAPDAKHGTPRTEVPKTAIRRQVTLVATASDFCRAHSVPLAPHDVMWRMHTAATLQKEQCPPVAPRTVHVYSSRPVRMPTPASDDAARPAPEPLPFLRVQHDHINSSNTGAFNPLPQPQPQPLWSSVALVEYRLRANDENAPHYDFHKTAAAIQINIPHASNVTSNGSELADFHQSDVIGKAMPLRLKMVVRTANHELPNGRA